MRKEDYDWIEQLCPICEVPPTRMSGRRGGAAHRERRGVECTVWRCGTCGLLFPNPMPVPARGVDQHYCMDGDDYFQNHDIRNQEATAVHLLRRAHELIGRKGTLLDIGSGRGILLRAARERGWDMTGIEPSRAFAEYATQYSGAEVRREVLERCGFPANSFDVVMLSAVLEHLYNPNETIQEIARILKPGGVLFVDVPNEEGLYFRVGNAYQQLLRRDWVVNLAPTFEPFHTFGFTPRSLRALMSKHRLTVVDWQISGGVCCLRDGNSPAGKLEALAARVVTDLSRIGNLGTYISIWVQKGQATPPGYRHESDHESASPNDGRLGHRPEPAVREPVGGGAGPSR